MLRVWPSGQAAGFQPAQAGSIPAARSNFARAASDAFVDLLAYGVCWIETRLDFEADVNVRRLEPLEVINPPGAPAGLFREVRHMQDFNAPQTPNAVPPREDGSENGDSWTTFVAKVAHNFNVLRERMHDLANHVGAAGGDPASLSVDEIAKRARDLIASDIADLGLAIGDLRTALAASGERAADIEKLVEQHKVGFDVVTETLEKLGARMDAIEAGVAKAAAIEAIDVAPDPDVVPVANSALAPVAPDVAPEVDTPSAPPPLDPSPPPVPDAEAQPSRDPAV